jgi:hypothetical protein
MIALGIVLTSRIARFSTFVNIKHSKIQHIIFLNRRSSTRVITYKETSECSIILYLTDQFVFQN